MLRQFILISSEVRGNIFQEKLFITKMPFYAVTNGRTTGIFSTWSECEMQVKGYSGARFKKFVTVEEAQEFLKNNENRDKLRRDRKTSTFSSGSPEHRLLQPSKTHTERTSIRKLFVNPLSTKISSSGTECNCDEVQNPFKSLLDDENDDFLLNVVENIDGQGTPRAQKRKASKEKHPHKKIKYESIVYKTAGLKKIGKYKFPVDSEGYVIVYTDGACTNNGKNQASAGLGVYFNKNHPLNISKPVTGKATNNAAEIQAVLAALTVAKDNGIEKIIINTDSQFLINSLTIWIWNWVKQDWKLNSGGPVKNAADFKKIYPFLVDNNFKIKWNYIKAHHGIKGNEEADLLAKLGAELQRN